MSYGKAFNKGSRVFNYRKIEKIFTLFALMVCCLTLTAISIFFKFGWESILLFLPLIFGVILTYKCYPNYKKTLKSFVDFILYFSSSITAIVYIIISTNIFEVLGENLKTYSAIIFLVLYLIAIITVVKCCVSYCDAVEAYRDETDKHIVQHDLKTAQLKSDSKLSTSSKFSMVIMALYILLK